MLPLYTNYHIYHHHFNSYTQLFPYSPLTPTLSFKAIVTPNFSHNLLTHSFIFLSRAHFFLWYPLLVTSSLSLLPHPYLTYVCVSVVIGTARESQEGGREG